MKRVAIKKGVFKPPWNRLPRRKPVWAFDEVTLWQEEILEPQNLYVRDRMVIPVSRSAAYRPQLISAVFDGDEEISRSYYEVKLQIRGGKIICSEFDGPLPLLLSWEERKKISSYFEWETDFVLAIKEIARD